MLSDQIALEKLSQLHFRHKDGACQCGLPYPCPSFQVLTQTPYVRFDMRNLTRRTE